MFGTPDDPYFVGKDVAEILGYKDTKGAIQKHVYDEHKTIFEKLETKLAPFSKTGEPEKPPDGLQAHTILINEAGLYSLIFRCKLPSAKKFNLWVTSEVLPAIRKHGRYEAPSVEVPSLIAPVIEMLQHHTALALQSATEFSLYNSLPEYDGYPCVYVGFIGVVDEKLHYKFGMSASIIKREQAHRGHFSQFSFVLVIRCEQSGLVENEFKKYVKDMGYLVTLGTQTEVFYVDVEFTVNQSLSHIRALVKKHSSVNKDDRIQELEHMLEIRDKDVEIEKFKLQVLVKDVEIEKFKLQIRELQLGDINKQEDSKDFGTRIEALERNCLEDENKSDEESEEDTESEVDEVEEVVVVATPKPRKKFTMTYVRECAASKGIESLETTYSNSKKSMHWRCLQCAREWTTSFTNFQKLKSCERCSGRRGYDITVVRKFAAECGLKCLETKWKNNSVAMRWACLECKYKWTACYGNIARSTKRGCPKCQDAFRSTYVLADVHRICAEKKIRCLEKTYKDCGEHMEFECDRCDRRWTTSFRSIIQNLGCLKCNHKAAMRRR